MYINKDNFPYEIKKEYIAEAKGFKIAILVYIAVYLIAIISFIVVAFPLDTESRDFITWLAILGFIPLAMLYNIFRKALLNSIPQAIPQAHKWLDGEDCNQITNLPRINADEKFLRQLIRERRYYYIEKEPSWDIRNILNRTNLYGKIKAVERCPFFLGTIYNRLFRVDFCEFFNIFSFSIPRRNLGLIRPLRNLFVDSKDGKIIHVGYLGWYKRFGVKFKGFLLRMKPLKSIKSTILIRPQKTFAKKIKNLQKIEIDTQGLFEIYTDNPQTLGQDLPQEFLSALIDYGKNIDKSITMLISPEGILCTKPASSIKDFFAPVLFTSIRNAFIREWAKYENFINLIEIINLLEPKK